MALKASGYWKTLTPSSFGKARSALKLHGNGTKTLRVKNAFQSPWR